MTDEELLETILRREGSAFTDHPADRGSATKFGITLATLRGLGLHPGPVGIDGDLDDDGDVDAEDVKLLTREQARTILASRYLAPFAFVMHEPLRSLLVDSGVQHGVRRAVRWLQGAVGTYPDGVVGPLTRTMLQARGNLEGYDSIRRAVLAARMRFYAQLLQQDPDQRAFAAGWINRLAGLV